MEPLRHIHRQSEDRPSSAYDRKTLLQDPMTMPRRRMASRGIPHGARVVLRGISLVLSLAIIGLLAHTLIMYNKTKYDRWQYPRGTMLPAWPRPAPIMRPIYLMLAAASAGALLNTLAFVSLLGALKQTRASVFGPLSAISSCFIAFAITTAAVAYWNLWNTNDHTQTDIWMWTCTHKQYEVSVEGKRTTFGTVCTELTFVWYAGMAVAAIEGLNLIACLYNTVKVEVVGSGKRGGYSRIEKEKLIHR